MGRRIAPRSAGGRRDRLAAKIKRHFPCDRMIRPTSQPSPGNRVGVQFSAARPRTDASALRMFGGGIGSVMDGCIVIRGSHHEKSAIINAQRKQSPRNSRTEGRGMFDGSREETFMLLNSRQPISASGTHHLEPSAFLYPYQIARPGHLYRHRRARRPGRFQGTRLVIIKGSA